jgi:hypothetical protein
MWAKYKKEIVISAILIIGIGIALYFTQCNKPIEGGDRAALKDQIKQDSIENAALMDSIKTLTTINDHLRYENDSLKADQAGHEQNAANNKITSKRRKDEIENNVVDTVSTYNAVQYLRRKHANNNP